MGPSDRVCVLASGGPDSALLIHKALRSHREVYPLYLRCGQIWEKAELHYLKRFLRAVRRPGLKPLQISDLPIRGVYGEHWSVTGKGVPGYRAGYDSVYMPGRNLMLLALAAAYCERKRIGGISIGVLKGNPFPDATPRFFRAAGNILRRTYYAKLRLHAPLLRSDKAAVYRALERAGLPLALTFSCMKPKGLRPCGSCSKCAERDLKIHA